MKPLILHASSKTENDTHRRVIHLEFNNHELPGGLDWLEREEVLKALNCGCPHQAKNKPV